MQKLGAIKEYLWKSFSSRFGSKYCSESMEDISEINLLQFSQNDKFLLVITRSLHSWILDTETWTTLNSIDLKKLKYKSSPNGPLNFDKIDFISCAALTFDAEYLYLGLTSGEIYVVEVQSHSVVYANQSHTNSITNIILFDDYISFLTSGEDADIKFWDINNEKPILIFKKHYASIEFLNIIPIDDRKLSVNNAQAISVDSSGMIIFWDLHDGTILQIKKIEPNASYLISETQPFKVLSASFRQEKVVAELLDLTTDNKIQSVENMLISEDLASTPSHMVSLQKINLESKKPNFFFATKNCKNYCIANRKDREIWVSNISQPGRRIKININMNLKILKANHNFTSFIASNGSCLKIYMLENNYHDFL